MTSEADRALDHRRNLELGAVASLAKGIVHDGVAAGDTGFALRAGIDALLGLKMTLNQARALVGRDEEPLKKDITSLLQLLTDKKLPQPHFHTPEGAELFKVLCASWRPAAPAQLLQRPISTSFAIHGRGDKNRYCVTADFRTEGEAHAFLSQLSTAGDTAAAHASDCCDTTAPRDREAAAVDAAYEAGRQAYLTGVSEAALHYTNAQHAAWSRGWNEEAEAGGAAPASGRAAPTAHPYAGLKVGDVVRPVTSPSNKYCWTIEALGSAIGGVQCVRWDESGREYVRKVFDAIYLVVQNTQAVAQSDRPKPPPMPDLYDTLHDTATGQAPLPGQALQVTTVLLAADRANRVYISGPMTGLADHNFPAFNAMAAELRAQGLHVENPADHGLVDGAEYMDYLRADIAMLATCARIHMLPGWTKSRGASIEHMMAQCLEMEITFAADAEQRPEDLVVAAALADDAPAVPHEQAMAEVDAVLENAAKGRIFWERLCKLPKFSFLLPPEGGVHRVADKGGRWVELAEVLEIVDAAENELADLGRFKEALDEWLEKTAWVQQTVTVPELGKHLADIMRERLARPAILLTPAEIQSGFDRVRWAEGLIKQLPANHEGRNSWLLNYGTKA